MKVELSKENRIKRYENSDAIGNLKRTISDRIHTEYGTEIDDLQTESKNLYAEEVKFRDAAKTILSGADIDTVLKVQTQVGEGARVIQTYTGHLERPFKFSDGTFNFVSNDKCDGRPFTIGFGCLLSVEIVTP